MRLAEGIRRRKAQSSSRDAASAPQQTSTSSTVHSTSAGVPSSGRVHEPSGQAPTSTGSATTAPTHVSERHPGGRMTLEAKLDRFQSHVTQQLQAQHSQMESLIDAYVKRAVVSIQQSITEMIRNSLSALLGGQDPVALLQLTLPPSVLPPVQAAGVTQHPSRGILHLSAASVPTAVPGPPPQSRVATPDSCLTSSHPAPVSGQAPAVIPSSPTSLSASAGPAHKGPVGING